MSVWSLSLNQYPRSTRWLFGQRLNNSPHSLGGTECHQSPLNATDGDGK